MPPAEKLTLTPEELAYTLVSRAIEDTSTVLSVHHERFRNYSAFQPKRFERQTFIYLVADFALGLMAAAQQQPGMAEVVSHFRQKVLVVMANYWGDIEAHADEDIEEASTDYARLIFTNPDEETDIFSLEWAQSWLRAVGIDEVNPAVLLGVASTWRIFHSHTLEALAAIHVQT
jgi:hypothetical protein